MTTDRDARRRFLKAVGVAAGATGAAAVARPGAATASTSATEPGASKAAMRELHAFPPPAAPSEPVIRLFGALTPGSALERWSLVSIHDVRHGAIPVVLATAAGETFQVDLVLRDVDGNAPRAIASAGHVSVSLVNQGNGASTTVEEQGLAAMALARALATHGAPTTDVPGLMTVRERSTRHPRAVHRVIG